MNKITAGSLGLWLAFSPTLCFSDEAAAKGQEIFEKNRHAVVTVQIVLKASYSKDGQTAPASEKRFDITGTVLDPSGLTVLAHSACDTAEFYKRVTPGWAEYKVESEITDVKLLLEDNTEVPAEIVLRDKDLDLAFVRPKSAPAHPMSVVNFSKSASPKVLEQVVTLNRLNSVSGRAYSAAVARILAVMEKPRPFYLHEGGGEGAKLGCPVFSLNGDIIGLIVMRTARVMSDEYSENATSIIIPAGDVLKAVKQVPPMQKRAGEKVQPGAAREKK